MKRLIRRLWSVPPPRASQPRRVLLGVEALEARETPALGISGYAFDDLNNNGLRDPGEPAIANSPIKLYNAANQVVGTAQTDANGFYRFLSDATIPPSQQLQTHSLQFADGPTNQNIVRSLPRFDPALGALLRVEIRIDGRITSQIKAENLDPTFALINGVVEGTVLLTAPGVSGGTNTSADVQSFNASAYDGLMDFAGASGVTFSIRTATGTEELTVTNAADLAAYVGSGSLQLTVMPQAASSASGGGNMVAQISSSGGAAVTVTYVYTGSQALRAGTYRVEQPISPVGYFDGKLSRNGQVLPPPVGSRSITVVYDAANEAPNNNFASLRAASLGGRVYIDANNDGIRQAGEVGIAGVKITLTGVNDLGRSVTQTATTDADGGYLFAGLRPGSYALAQTAPQGFLAGQLNAAGSLGGQVQANKFLGIAAGSGAVGAEYNFGWLKPATLSGWLYADKNKNGAFDAGDRGVKKLTVRLTGVDDLGQAVSRTVKSGADGYYEFTGLRPGNYEISQSTVPGGWRRGAINIGSIGGITAQDALTDIEVGVGDYGRDYNFAFELSSFSKRNYLGSAWRGRDH